MWDIELAKLFKNRDNPNRIGAILGTVVSKDPLKISILEGNAILEKEELYITHGMLEKEYKFKLSANGGVGDITTKATTEKTEELININITEENKDKTNLKLYFELEKDDKVLLIPAESEQVFFIVDKVKKVGE